jgi:hypothetical protein
MHSLTASLERVVLLSYADSMHGRAEYDSTVDSVLADLTQGVEKYIFDRSDIYHIEVAVELKHVIVVAGRGYKVEK